MVSRFAKRVFSDRPGVDPLQRFDVVFVRAGLKIDQETKALLGRFFSAGADRVASGHIDSDWLGHVYMLAGRDTGRCVNRVEVGRRNDHDRIEFLVHGNEEALLKPITRTVSDVFGCLHDSNQKAVSVEEMNEAIAQRVRERNA